MYLLSALGVTVGFHRLLTHRAFETRAWLRYTLAVLGLAVAAGPVIDWVADHRKHHTFTDEEGDPHSPHAGHGAGLRGMLSGPLARARRLAVRDPRPGLLEDASRPTSSRTRTMRRINRGFPLIALGSLLVPVPARLRAERRLARGGRPARRCCGPGSCGSSSCTTSPGASTRSATSSGSRRFDTDDESTNVFWLALPSLGEAWHHNHHAFPRSAFHGLRWYELDPSGWLILGARARGARLGRGQGHARARAREARGPARDAPGLQY